MPITRILVPLDGSPFAERALPLALRLARLAGGSLVLVRVEEPPPPPVGGIADFSPPPFAGVDETVRLADAAYLDGVAARLRAAGADAHAVVVDGEVVHGLRAACERERVDLVVMASHARGGLARLLLGSVADRVLHDGPRVPVLVARGHAEDGVEREIGRIVVALEEGDAEGEGNEATVDAALEIARLSGAAVTLVMAHDADRDRMATLLPTAVLAPAANDADVALPDDVPSERSYLARVAHALAADGVPADVRVVEGRDPADAIARCVAEVRADLVAVGAHGKERGGLADALRHAVEVPVLVVPGPAAGASA